MLVIAVRNSQAVARFSGHSFLDPLTYRIYLSDKWTPSGNFLFNLELTAAARSLLFHDCVKFPVHVPEYVHSRGFFL